LRFLFLINIFFMSKMAVIKTGGKQYKVKIGDIIKIEKLPANDGSKVKFDTLLIASADAREVSIGKPSLGNKVEGKILAHGQGKKVHVIKYKSKTRYKRNIGHRQHYSQIKITGIA